MTNITPTIGRVVWFYRHGKTQHDAGEQPEAALVAFVHGDGRYINIGFFDHNGVSCSLTSVRLIQEGEEMEQSPFCCWMPYQQAQAKKNAQT